MTPIEAGAKAWFDRVQSQRLDAGRKRPDGLGWQWEDLTESDRVGYRALVRPIVEAVEHCQRFNAASVDDGPDSESDVAPRILFRAVLEEDS